MKPNLDEIRSRVDKWRVYKDVGGAADLLNYAHIPDAREVLREPALILKSSLNADGSPPIINKLLKKILGSDGSGRFEDLAEARASESHIYGEISRLKRYVQINPGDAISLVDMGRYYTILGQLAKARSVMSAAVAICPNNRFVLRSASRFFIHEGDPDRALFLLNRSARTPGDPWLLATHISIEGLIGRVSKFLKRGRQILDGGRISPLHSSELGASIATVFLNDGLFKEAKRTFSKALACPNENAVAQALWASTSFRIPINVKREWLDSRFSHEANFYRAQIEVDFVRALEFAKAWYEDEPFSSRPLRGAAFACSVLNLHAQAEGYTRQALLCDPHSIDDRNNLVFSLASQGKISDAFELIKIVINRQSSSSEGVSGQTLANIGLLSYRIGDIESARQYYGKAVDYLQTAERPENVALARAFWAKEALLAKDSEFLKILGAAKESAEETKTPGAIQVIKGILGGEGLNAEVDNSSVPLIRRAETWAHDAQRNLLIIKSKTPFGKADK
ncbi:hypothetical protein [Achromobacter insuavis]|uniref:hypothetical protein n=1 Tax=Achromobacter insuavis TaxID=1287735 RepID=UPI001F12E433|nr:hypothetical protein [Achromobacter insuavis]